jgi:hypothetical protein
VGLTGRKTPYPHWPRRDGNRFEELIKRKGVDTTNGPAVAALVVEHMRDRC